MDKNNIKKKVLNYLSDATVKNFITQGDARYILFDVNEPLDNFPKYRENLNQGLDSIAYSLLSMGCTLAESEFGCKESIVALEKAADIISNNHRAIQNRTKYSSYHLIIAGLAYYASAQYSKSFIILNNNEHEGGEADISKMLFLFLTKQFNSLQVEFDNIFFDDTQDQDDDLLFIRYLYAKSILYAIRYLQIGNGQFLNKASEVIDDINKLAILGEDPSIWWIGRLLKLILANFNTSSLWSNLFEYDLKDAGDNVNNYIRGMAFRDKYPIVELFNSQKAALPKVNTEKGAIISLPTSSGKTRIAEIAILNALIEKPYSKVLYIAPFRSLAFELEHSLSISFAPAGFEVSHLYGGAQYTSMDSSIIDESEILIATPEKAKAILRVNTELANSLSLVIMDEGHLLGDNERFIRNEMYSEELRCLLKNTGGKIILLSAVLPNATELSTWITDSEENVVKNNWRPASQRFGKLLFHNNNVRLNWIGEESSFNPNFLPPKLDDNKDIIFPCDKKDAVCGVAAKLSNSGTVLVFVGLTSSVKTHAENTYKIFENSNNLFFEWGNRLDWEQFELTCIETEGRESYILKCAKAGIICHNGRLNADLRLSIEKLMRNGKPRVIVSTSTLAQGVNIGISTVIFASVWQSGNPISNSDFWNICGRAGRAFVDTEGKILYAIDEHIASKKLRREHRFADNYFSNSNPNNAESGILHNLRMIFSISERLGINSDLLLELITENNFERFGEDSPRLSNFFDYIDDSLLSIYKLAENMSDNPMAWLDSFYSTSLASIQSNEEAELEKVKHVFIARTNSVKKMSEKYDDVSTITSSGIPLQSAIFIQDNIADYVNIAEKYLESDNNIDEIVTFVIDIETLIKTLPTSHFACDFAEEDVNVARGLWLKGACCNEHNVICAQYFGYTLPWAINAVAKILRANGHDDYADIYERIGILVEYGLPTYHSVRIYNSGIRSRQASLELSKYISKEDIEDMSLSNVRRFIIDNKNEYFDDVTQNTKRWVELLMNQEIAAINTIVIENIIVKIDFDKSINELIVREHNNALILTDLEYSKHISISKEKSPSSVCKIINLSGAGLRRIYENQWELFSINPYVKIVRQQNEMF